MQRSSPNPCLSLNYNKEGDGQIVNKMYVVDGGLSRGAVSLLLVPLLLAEGEFLGCRQVTWCCARQTSTSQTLIPNKARLVVAREAARDRDGRWTARLPSAVSLSLRGLGIESLGGEQAALIRHPERDRLRVIAPEPAPGPS
jgi:hypothetical protein